MVNWHPLETIWHPFEGAGREIFLVAPRVQDALLQPLVGTLASKTTVVYVSLLPTPCVPMMRQLSWGASCGPYRIHVCYLCNLSSFTIKTNNYNVGKYIIDGSYGYWHTGYIIKNLIVNCWKMWQDITSICFLLLFLDLLLFKTVVCYCIVSCCSSYSYVCTWQCVN